MIPFRLRDRVRIMKALVVSEVPHTLILGAYFWRRIGIVPDLRHGELCFSEQPAIVDAVDQIRSQRMLN